MRAALAQALPQATFHGGDLPLALLDGASLLAPSPGLSPTRSPAAPIVAAARARGVPVAGEVELFARALAELAVERGYRPRVLGITGTNGKTTTTRLAGLLVARAGRSVAVAGNISPTALDALRERLAGDTLPEVWVLELSSFQLAGAESLACDAAAVLNLSQDHLDWHGSFDDYAAAKARIFTRATVRVLNRDDPRVLAMQALPQAGARGRTPAEAEAHARRRATDADRPPPPVTFGAGAPTQPDEYGLVREGGIDWLAYAEDLSLGHRRRKAAAELPGIEGEVYVHRLMPVDALRIRGRHNALNALAALALARAIGCPLAPMLHALREYRGEPHRIEPIASVDGVTYYDDSKGTNVGATVAALEALGAEGLRLVAILGGDGKGQDFAPLAAPLAAHARAVVLIGRDAPAIGRALAGASYPVEPASDLPQAVRAAARLARCGDAVLLSPACASLDMFRSYAHRSEVFAAAVRELAAREVAS
jgi:UDP-N-acetylmuramoylalanine--D-glutamate ligase